MVKRKDKMEGGGDKQREGKGRKKRSVDKCKKWAGQCVKYLLIMRRKNWQYCWPIFS